MPKLTSLKQPQPLAKMAYDALRASIVSGHLKPGEIYNEMALAKELEISRTPVREALLELAARGLVTFRPRKGVQVNSFSRRDVAEIFEVRAAIELFCAEMIASRRDRLNLDRLKEIFEEQEQAFRDSEMETFMDRDRLFHLELGVLIGNRRLSEIMDNLRDMVRIMGLEALTGEGRAEEVLTEHRHLVQALEAGDVPAARVAMALHLGNSKAAVLAAHPEPHGQD